MSFVESLDSLIKIKIAIKIRNVNSWTFIYKQLKQLMMQIRNNWKRSENDDVSSSCLYIII